MCDHASQATTSIKRPPFQNTRIFTVLKGLIVGSSRKRPLIVSEGDYFLGGDFSLFLSGCLIRGLISLFDVCTVRLGVFF